MLQRIQTIYLLIVLLLSGLAPFFLSLWTTNNGKTYFFMQNMVYATFFGLATSLSLLSIISYNKRQNQFVINRLNMILNLILLGLFVYRSLNISGETPAVSEKEIGRAHV